MTAPSSGKSSGKDLAPKSATSSGSEVAASSGKRRRRRAKHPGVVLLKPDAGKRMGWRARFTDADSGKTVWETLDAGLTTAELREDWAVRKWKSLARRRLELEGGAPRETGTGLGSALDRYFKDHPHLGDRTRRLYRGVADRLAGWGAAHGVDSGDDLTGAILVAFRAELVKQPKRVKLRGGKRGAVKASKAPRSANAVNAELRAIGTVLGYVRRLGLLPRLTSDALRDGLAKLKAAPKRIDYRKPAELQRLLDAALRHDADPFAATRAEHAGEGTPGSTPRYTPIAPVIAGALMTGMRVGHLLALDWTDVDLEALDGEGRVVGEIVPAAGSVTKRTGVIGLEVSPALRRMLAALKLASGGRRAVFAVTRGEADAALKRLRAEYGAPAGSTWQALRRTCGCYLTNAPGIFGAASAYRSAKQLGHSVAVAEKHYVDVVRGIPRDARTLEAAMQIEAQMTKVIETVSLRRRDRAHSARSDRK